MGPTSDNLLLDLGGVLVGADHSLAIEAFSSLTGRDEEFMRAAIYKSGLIEQFETGAVGVSEFRAAVCRALEIEIPAQLFDDAWCRTVYELPETRGLLAELARRYRLYVLSNTNPIHFKAIQSMFPDWIGLIKGFHLSFEVGLTKPSRDYFDLAMKRFDLTPRACVFLDDSDENTSSASLFGIRAHTVGPNGIAASELRSWGLL